MEIAMIDENPGGIEESKWKLVSSGNRKVKYTNFEMFQAFQDSIPFLEVLHKKVEETIPKETIPFSYYSQHLFQYAYKNIYNYVMDNIVTDNVRQKYQNKVTFMLFLWFSCIKSRYNERFFRDSTIYTPHKLFRELMILCGKTKEQFFVEDICHFGEYCKEEKCTRTHIIGYTYVKEKEYDYDNYLRQMIAFFYNLYEKIEEYHVDMSNCIEYDIGKSHNVEEKEKDITDILQNAFNQSNIKQESVKKTISVKELKKELQELRERQEEIEKKIQKQERHENHVDCIRYMVTYFEEIKELEEFEELRAKWN